MNSIIESFNKFKEHDLRDKISSFIFILLMLLAYSIAFGHKYGEALIFISFILWFFVITKEKLKEIALNKVIIVFFMLILMHYISLIWSEDYKSGLNYTGSILRYIFIPSIIYLTIVTKDKIKYIITAFIFGMFTNEIISYLIYFDIYHTDYSIIHRYPVGFINHIPYSVLVAFTAILILNQTKHINNNYLKILYVVFFITMTTNLVISSGRTGYVVYFGSLIIMLFTYYKLSIKNFLYILVFPTIVFIVGYKLNEDVQKRIEASITAVEKIDADSNYNTSFGARLGFYPMTLDIVSQENNSYFFGVGVGDSKQEIYDFCKRSDMFNKRFKHTHNSYLEAYLKTGVIGLVLFIMLFIYLWKTKVQNKEILFIKQLFIISFMISMLGDHIFRTKEMMFFMAIFMAISIIQERYEIKMKGAK